MGDTAPESGFGGGGIEREQESAAAESENEKRKRKRVIRDTGLVIYEIDLIKFKLNGRRVVNQVEKLKITLFLMLSESFHR